MANNREDKERDRPESQDGGDRIGRVFFVGFDGALRGDDGGDTADGRADREQRDELGSEVEALPEPGHEGERQGDLDEDQKEGDAAEFSDIAKDEAGTKQDDAGLEPELVGSHTPAKDLGNADGVGDDEADKDGPEDVLDVGQHKMVGLAIAGDELLDELAGIADNGQQKNAGKQAEETGRAGVCRRVALGEGGWGNGDVVG